VVDEGKRHGQPSILERDLRGTLLNAGAGEGPAPNYATDVGSTRYSLHSP
jgi:hypothetical protein